LNNLRLWFCRKRPGRQNILFSSPRQWTDQHRGAYGTL
jgi:hypothetical protein